MSMPKVNIVAAASAVTLIVSTTAGTIWYAAGQASIISNLEETVAQLSAQSEIQDKVNMQRDILANSDRLNEVDEDMNDLWQELDMAWEDLEGMTSHMMEIVKLQSRIAILEKTVEFTRRDGM
jgi:peptidoglycan hydrolase CwlO-like protein